MDLERLERKLIERLEYPYNWGSRQTNNKDSLTNFIYNTYSIKNVIKKANERKLEPGLKDYAMVRWYNFWSAKGIEALFAMHKIVSPNPDEYDRHEDFKLDGIPFDHKTSNFPSGFNHDIDYAKENEDELIKWLYDNQSNTKRNLNQNRLFVVMYDKETGDHWRMKAYISKIKEYIDNYVKNFKREDLHTISFDDGSTALASIIWIER